MSDQQAENEDGRKKKCIFFDMKHSNNAARIRLWLRLHGGLEDRVETIMLGHDDMDDGRKLSEVNPLKKVPALVTDTGLNLFESFVILSYLEDRFGSSSAASASATSAAAAESPSPCLVPDTPDDRAFVQLLVRVHDVYISSPNCTQPNFSHTQGCMYLDAVPTAYTPERRTMPDTKVRAAKLREIHDRLSWLEGMVKLPYMAGRRITHADVTWWPTCIFMEVLLPYVFGWSSMIFRETEHFPRLSRWFEACGKNEHFASVRRDIYDVLMRQKEDGRFDGVREVVRINPGFKWAYM